MELAVAAEAAVQAVEGAAASASVGAALVGAALVGQALAKLLAPKTALLV